MIQITNETVEKVNAILSGVPKERKRRYRMRSTVDYPRLKQVLSNTQGKYIQYNPER